MPSVAVLNAADIERAANAARAVVQVHTRLAEWLHPGVTLAQIDKQVAAIEAELGCRSCFLGYKAAGHPPFPSHACLSVNDCVVHGTAASFAKPLGPGDLLKVDIGVVRDQWIGDAAWTYCFGPPSDTARRLMDAGKESIAAGIEQLRVGLPYLRWAQTVQDVVEGKHGLRCVENWGGHGIGRWRSDSDRGLHLPPHVLNHRPKAPNAWPEASHTWRAGNLVAVEPMIAVGTGATEQRPIGRYTNWPVYTADGSLSVHYEHDVLITDQGPRVLTAGLEALRDVIL